MGAGVCEHWIQDDPKPKWAINSDDYLKEALRVVKQRLSEVDMSLKSKANNVLPSGYKPELDSTDYLNDEGNMQCIGILRWMVELNRIDICCEVSMMSAYNAAPRVGHLDAVLHIFAYLSTHNRSRIVMDDKSPDLLEIPRHDWKQFYPFAKNVKPLGMPKPPGKSVTVTMFVDASHAANLIRRQSRTGVLIFINHAPILWYSKKQNSVETSSFGSEFMALKTGMELLEALQYKLRMIGVPIDGYAHVRVDNMSVVRNSSVPESTLQKKSNSIAYHYVQSKCAADVARIAYESTKTNLADMLTKVQVGHVRLALARGVMY